MCQWYQSKSTGSKAACKMMMKLTKVVDFINSLICCFYRCKYPGPQNLFHQHIDAKPHLLLSPYSYSNFYALHSTPCASQISINLLSQKPLVKWWWNWLQVFVGHVCNAGRNNKEEKIIKNVSGVNNITTPELTKQYRLRRINNVFVNVDICCQQQIETEECYPFYDNSCFH